MFELRAAIEFDEKFMGDATNLIVPLEQELRELKNSVDSGNHSFGGSDLHYMEIIESAHPQLLPFKFLLTTINRVHINGLDSETDS